MNDSRVKTSVSMRDIGILLVVGVFIAMYSLVGSSEGRAPISSAEVQFTDPSTKGLSIVPASCPSSPHYQGECSSCTATYFCSGNNLMYRNAQCQENLIQVCSYGCAGGGCFLPSSGNGNIIVSPALIRSGETTTVSWTTSDMVSCTVTESNPAIVDAWTGVTDSEKTSAISEQTVYTLTCVREAGGTFTDSATVNIIPIFQER